MLAKVRILLGISGGIAAYKSAELTRLLIKAGADVRVVMTEGAQAFITPLTFQALSGNPVHTHLLDPEAEAGMGHIELAKWADLIVIAPASADVMARLASGMADDLLTTLCLATEAKVLLAPAMNQAMWRHPATQGNAKRLAGYGYQLLGPGQGEQACGDVGPGRMLEPEALVTLISKAAVEPQAELLSETVRHDFRGLLAGKTVTITAGPTREAVDPVRYISNHSSGKMGFALAQASLNAGAKVNLIAGPVQVMAPEGVNLTSVQSAQQMLDASLSVIGETDIFIAAAAVADYRPSDVADQKMKKQPGQDNLVLHLVQNPDIVATVARHVQRPFTVGFAAETQDVEAYAADKLVRKNLDMIIANDVSRTDIGFNSDQNAVTLLWQEKSTLQSHSPEQAAKQDLAQDLILCIAHRFHQGNTDDA
ncbi:bifunctional phosphopantothenoylcysteine decarboxylase/phosphopantothenate--cysteine ligase CoaBC [Oceanospirillum linum]|uniref:Coenzyme A biosynthesis bifunctional protein CoaBC n=1 Tax=Oceanospirillum linum TaxID=966 RepID=A0A1T1H8S7_OCELI|nr:bifunctional phosphopantothenoylcysteine decarboxylase/phosphopantothenate--cysteine ligase CoaBC [Oceanospirillum linum]OOV86176.1 bifunctional 4'-phosphopantothenoylcysteine decarboxylase/phosphopantothenoylcysteine synthetase [Oceanospirillum linum]SEG38837.1 phosphopantothenoylcysteine decarboxylase / phosphopantothenate--cysteine ligase [Oleiphilus messinensis]SMP31876.1 phosphopantothenoylcysteine decarboxylase / phosphopantothenate--cysteine ligase [Oceanospirillum linum]